MKATYAEKAVDIIKTRLNRLLITTLSRQWDLKLPEVLIQYNSTPKAGKN